MYFLWQILFKIILWIDSHHQWFQAEWIMRTLGSKFDVTEISKLKNVSSESIDNKIVMSNKICKNQCIQ